MRIRATEHHSLTGSCEPLGCQHQSSFSNESVYSRLGQHELASRMTGHPRRFQLSGGRAPRSVRYPLVIMLVIYIFSVPNAPQVGVGKA